MESRRSSSLILAASLIALTSVAVLSAEPSPKEPASLRVRPIISRTSVIMRSSAFSKLSGIGATSMFLIPFISSTLTKPGPSSSSNLDASSSLIAVAVAMNLMIDKRLCRIICVLISLISRWKGSNIFMSGIPQKQSLSGLNTIGKYGRPLPTCNSSSSKYNTLSVSVGAMMNTLPDLLSRTSQRSTVSLGLFVIVSAKGVG